MKKSIKINRCKPSTEHMCIDCANAIYIGEGDSVCYENAVPTLVMIDFEPSEDFNFCGGRKWLEQ